MRLCPISQIVLLNVRGRTLFWVIIFNPFFALSSSAPEEAGAFEKPVSKDDLDGAQNNYFMFNLVTILMMRNFQLIPICSESLLLEGFAILNHTRESANFARAESKRNGKWLTLYQQGSKAANPISKAHNFSPFAIYISRARRQRFAAKATTQLSIICFNFGRLQLS
jgi:hypothetical protein